LITNSAKIKDIFDIRMDKQYVLQHISVEERSKDAGRINAGFRLF